MMASVAALVLWAAGEAGMGFVALRQQEAANAQEQARVKALEAQNRELNQQVHALQTDPNAIEDIARKQLHLTRPGEVIYTYSAAPAAGAAARASR